MTDERFCFMFPPFFTLDEDDAEGHAHSAVQNRATRALKDLKISLVFGQQ